MRRRRNAPLPCREAEAAPDGRSSKRRRSGASAAAERRVRGHGLSVERGALTRFAAQIELSLPGRGAQNQPNLRSNQTPLAPLSGPREWNPDIPSESGSCSARAPSRIRSSDQARSGRPSWRPSSFSSRACRRRSCRPPAYPQEPSLWWRQAAVLRRALPQAGAMQAPPPPGPLQRRLPNPGQKHRSPASRPNQLRLPPSQCNKVDTCDAPIFPRHNGRSVLPSQPAVEGSKSHHIFRP